MSDWWQNNWDKILTLVLGGVIGFFSGIIATNQSISTLNERIAKIEAKAQSNYDPAFQKLSEANLKLIGLENDLNNLEQSQDLSDKLVELHISKFQIELEKVRKATIDALNEFVSESKPE